MTYTFFRAEYLYPGVFMPESTYRDLAHGTFNEAVRMGPAEDGYFRKDGWYAVKITKVTRKTFTADDGETLDKDTSEPVSSYVVGELTGDDNVLARCGNMQPASYYDHVIDPRTL